MFVFRVVFIFFSLVHISLYAEQISQPYSTDMVINSQKYVVYAYLANKIYDEGDSSIGQTKTIFDKKLKLVRYETQDNGFQAGIYKNLNTNKYIMAVGGTMANPKEADKFQKLGGTILDLTTDLRLLSNLIPDSQSKSVLDFINNRVVSENGKNKVVTIDAIVGHSLGGGLAAYAGLYSGIKAYTFNPSPIPVTKDSIESFLYKHAITFPNGVFKKNKPFRIEFTHGNKITNIMSYNDPVSNISFLLEATDKKYYDAKSNLKVWNNVKLVTLFVPKELHLDYANIGKNIWLPIETGHSMAKMLEKMKDAKGIDDDNKLDAIYTYYSDKLKKIRNNNYGINTYELIYYNEKADMNSVLANMRRIYATIKKISIAGSDDTWDDYFTYDKFMISLGLKDTDLAKRIKVSIKGDISYKEYMLVAEAMYKKIFGGPTFFANLVKKTKKRPAAYYNKNYSKYANIDMNKIYKHIFVLHYSKGTPKKYLQNENQAIHNGFIIKFLDRFLDVLVMYKSKIK